eukprot:237143_1
MGSCVGKEDQKNAEEFLDLEAGGSVVDVSNHGEVDQSLEKMPRPTSGHITNYVVIGFVALLVITAVLSGMYCYRRFSAGQATYHAADQATNPATYHVSNQATTENVVDELPIKPPVKSPEIQPIMPPVKSPITPTDQAAGNVVDHAASKVADETTDHAADKAADEPTDRATGKADDQSAGKSTGKATGKATWNAVDRAASRVASKVASNAINKAIGKPSSDLPKMLELEKEIARAVNHKLTNYFLNTWDNAVDINGIKYYSTITQLTNMNVHLAIVEECDRLSEEECNELTVKYFWKKDGRNEKIAWMIAKAILSSWAAI